MVECVCGGGGACVTTVSRHPSVDGIEKTSVYQNSEVQILRDKATQRQTSEL